MNTSSGKPVALLIIVWLVVAIGVSSSGLLLPLRPPAPQLIIVILTLASFAAARSVPGLRAWTDHVDLRVLVALHLTRVIAGLNFLVMARRGELPGSFALPAGYGDIAVGLSALLLILTIRPGAPRAQRWYMAWNIFGLADILFVVGNAARTGLTTPDSMKPLLQLPLSLLPTFLVPLIITTHLLLFRRLK